MRRRGLVVAGAAAVLDVLYLGVFLGWTHWHQDLEFLAVSIAIFGALCLVIVGGLGYEMLCMMRADRIRNRVGVYRGVQPMRPLVAVTPGGDARHPRPGATT